MVPLFIWRASYCLVPGSLDVAFSLPIALVMFLDGFPLRMVILVGGIAMRCFISAMKLRICFPFEKAWDSLGSSGEVSEGVIYLTLRSVSFF